MLLEKMCINRAHSASAQYAYSLVYFFISAFTVRRMNSCCAIKASNRFNSVENERSRRPSRARCKNQRCKALNPKFGLERCGLCVRPGIDFCHHHLQKCTGPNAIWPTVDRLMIPSVIGGGLYLNPSTLGEESGLGVFAARFFKKKDLVTFYDGEVFSMTNGSAKQREYQNTPRSSHFLKIRGTVATQIDGVRKRLRNREFDIVGRGAGSMMNSVLRGSNTECVIMERMMRRMKTSNELWPEGPGEVHVPSVHFYATRDIEKDEELFWDYPSRDPQDNDRLLPTYLQA